MFLSLGNPLMLVMAYNKVFLPLGHITHTVRMIALLK